MIDPVYKYIEKCIPGRKTKLFVALLVLVAASVFLALGKLTSGEWVTVVLTVLGMYSLARYKSDKDYNGGGG